MTNEKKVKDLMDALSSVFNYGSRFPGENPACDPIEDELAAILNKYTDDELDRFYSSLNNRQLNEIYAVTMNICGNRTKFKRYADMV